MARQNPRDRTPVCVFSLRRSEGEGPMRENDEPARKKTEKRTKAETGRKCMPGRRVEERVKSNEAMKETGGSQQPNKGRAQGRGQGRHTASTTPHQDTGEGSTTGTREERHRAPRHAQHRHHTHRTHPTSPGSPPRGRGAGGEGVSDPRSPSQRRTATPPGTPYRQPHGPQRQPARARAVGPVQGPHARTDRTRDTRVAEPWLPAPEDGRPGEGQRLTPGAPHNGGRQPPPGDGPPATPRHAAPTGHAGQRDSVGHPHPHTRTHSTWVADPNSPPSGRAVGRGTAPDLRRPSQWWKAPPPGTPFCHPQSEQRRPARAHAVGPVQGPSARTDPTRDTRVAEPWLPAPEDGRPGEGQRLTPGAPHSSGRPPPPPGMAPHDPRGKQPPQGMQAKGTVLGTQTHTRAPTAGGWRTPKARPVGRQLGEGQRLTSDAPHNGGRHPSRGHPFRQPHSEQRRPARAHAVGPVLGPHARTNRTRDPRVAEPWLPAPEDGRPGEGQRLTPGAPHNGGRPPPPEKAPHHPRGMQHPQGMQAKGTVLGSHTHSPAPTARGWRAQTARPVGRQLGEGQRLTSDAPHNGGRHPSRGHPFRQPHSEQRRPARAHAVGPVLGPHARTNRTRDPRVAEPWLPAPEDGRPGEGQRLTPGAPHNGGRPPPPEKAPHHPRGMQHPQGMQAKGTVLGSHTHSPAPTARGWRAQTARPVGGQSGEGQRLASDAPHNGGRHHPCGRPSATPAASNAGPQGRTLWGRCWVPTPAPTAPGTHGSRNPGCPLQRTGGRGRDSA